MPLHNASTRDDLPQYDNPHKQEAVEFLARDINEQPLIDGMEDIDRVDGWLQVVDRFEGKRSVGNALRDRRAQLEDELDQQTEITPASETDAGQEALADGGAEAVPQTDDWEPDDDQEVVDYEDPAERESMKRDAAGVAKMFDSEADVKEKIAEERDSDRVRPHVIDALQERLEVLE